MLASGKIVQQKKFAGTLEIPTKGNKRTIVVLKLNGGMVLRVRPSIRTVTLARILCRDFWRVSRLELGGGGFQWLPLSYGACPPHDCWIRFIDGKASLIMVPQRDTTE